MLKNIYVAGGMRTPFGSLNGSLSSLTAAELGGIAIRSALRRGGVKPEDVDEVLFGNVLQAGHGQNVARQASIAGGLPTGVGATAINKVCGSGMRAVILSAQAVQCGDGHLFVAGGTESMTNAPYLLQKARTGYRMGDGELIDALVHDGLWDVYTNQHMGHCGNLCARKYKVSREEQDDFSIESYRRAIAAWEDGFYASNVVPIEIKSRNGVTVVDRDEDIKKFRGEEKLRGLRSAFGPDGSITAGNASKVTDGAAAMIVFDDEKKTALGLKPAARILGHANVAMESDWFTIAPIHAIRLLCDRLSIKAQDVDLYEINEAFAIVCVVAMRELGLDHAKVNVAGGAVAIGHPLGTSGARIVNTLVRAMERHEKKLGVACLCIGGGEASAIALERCT